MARGRGGRMKRTEGVRIGENDRYKYPSTPYLPWSLGRDPDDPMLIDTRHFEGQDVVVTAKMDGENTTWYSDGSHARSLDSKNHPSRNLVKQMHAATAWQIPQGWRICGENMYAEHSIKYNGLPSYFMVFSIWDENNHCLDWDDMSMVCEELGLETVPVLYRGTFDEKKIRSLWPYQGLYGEQEPEGYVLRTAKGFDYDDFTDHLAKFVRLNHVQTDEHWTNKAIVPNELAISDTTDPITYLDEENSSAIEENSDDLA